MTRPEVSVHSKEKDVARAREIVARGTVLRGLVGSEVHGLSNPGTDDRDEMAICLEPASHVVGLRQFEHYISRTQPDGMPSGPGDVDLSVYSARKFCRLALKGSPTVLLLLFIEGDHVMIRTDVGAQLQQLAPAFLSKQTGRSFLGYLESQRKSLADTTAARERERSAEHGYDTKYAMHALRIGLQGIELLTSGRITLPVPEPDRTGLRDIRAGGPALPEVIEQLDEVTARLERLTETAELPDHGDSDAIDRFLVEAHQAFWAG